MKAARPSDWRTVPLPLKRSTVTLDRRFSWQEIKRMRAGVIPEVMEDKWFIYWKANTLFFHRSWTGSCLYVVRFAREGDSYRMVEADVNRDPEQYTETRDDFDARMISFLIDVLLLKREATFSDLDQDPENQALKMWSLVGRAMLGEDPKNE